MILDDFLELISQLVANIRDFVLLAARLAGGVLDLGVDGLELGLELLDVHVHLVDRALDGGVLGRHCLQLGNFPLILQNVLLDLLFLLMQVLELHVVLSAASLLLERKALADHGLEAPVHESEHVRQRVVR